MIYAYITMLGIYIILFVLSYKEEERNPFRRMALYIMRRRRSMSQHKSAGKHNWKRDLQERQLTANDGSNGTVERVLCVAVQHGSHSSVCGGAD